MSNKRYLSTFTNVYLHQKVLSPRRLAVRLWWNESILFNHSFDTHHILYIVSQIRNCETSICLRVTWPRWPSSQERAGGLLKHAILCVYQACRTNSFAIQKVSRATGAAASTARSWQLPVQLRASWRTDILQDREWQTAVVEAGGSLIETGPPSISTETNAATIRS